jgi:hypothetical protein
MFLSGILHLGGQSLVAGCEASASLAAEFTEWDDRAKRVAYEDFYGIYVRMREMFEWCALHGAVSSCSVG